MSSKTKKSPKPPTKATSNIIWFEIPADKPDRAKKFYSSMFGWKISLFPGMKEYWHIDTGGPDSSPDAGLMPRRHPGQGITNYFHVASVVRASAKVVKLGGKVRMPKTAVPGMGYFAVCEDPEANVFALWEVNPKAK